MAYHHDIHIHFCHFTKLHLIYIPAAFFLGELRSLAMKSAQGDPENPKDPTWRSSQGCDEPRPIIVLLIQRLSRFGFKFCHDRDPGSDGKWMEMVGMELEYNQ